MGGGRPGLLQSHQALRKLQSRDMIWRADLIHICLEHIGPVVGPKECLEKETNVLKKNKGLSIDKPTVYLFPLSLLFPTSPLCPIRIICHLISLCYQKNYLVPWFFSLSVVWELFQN